MDNLDNIKDYVDIPNDIDLAIKKGIERGREEKKKSESMVSLVKNKKVFKKAAIIAAAGVIGIISVVGFINPNVVKAIPGVQSIFKLVAYNQDGETLSKFEKFSTSVNKTIEKNGIKVTINEITIDDNSLAITSTVEGKNLNENTTEMGQINLNGQSLKSWGSKNKKINDNEIAVVTYANVSDINLSDSIEVEMNTVWISDVKGPWNFKFTVSKADKQSNSKIITLDKTIKIPNSTLKLDKLVISPLGNTINYSGVYDKENPSMRDGIYSFLVLDDKGRTLEAKSSGSSSNKNKYEGKIQIDDDLSNIKSITVVPIFKYWGTNYKKIEDLNCEILQTTINSENFNLPQEEVTKTRPVTAEEKSKGYALDDVIHIYNMDKTREFVSLEKLTNQKIKVGKNITATIKNIEATDKYTKLTFQFEGNGGYSPQNINMAVILDENYKDTERAEDGDLAVQEDIKDRIVSIKLPPIDKTKKYKIAIPTVNEPEILDQYKVKIDLEK
ncbi:DUF4179 domain-containing protein [Clostridium folliculivorans]|uniref:DUF4179 domain-containing protein n=1 Tax=Clostridium folliculivorans TaxID=2886038 RepID=A0A9W5Y1Y0_9CLOT|nr:DUF4179 domain-containing protein [Clostridium folliculivorans]GKU25069.1 hypothetical protein CFOLD11_18950 [Clostridium folliculivorans]GKU31167.1 hypothetical protein CFB3_32740 [Clostridium folliculivorans]